MNRATRPAETLAKMIKAGPVIMGILNVTPDSFSDGGDYNETQSAVSRAKEMIAQGAHIIDIGGESTRPGATPVSIEEEIRRTSPVIAALKSENAILSIDTRNPQTMRASLEAGATLINDVTALTHDPESLETAASFDVPVCLMHMKGNPQTMQSAPQYADVVEEVYGYLMNRAEYCLKAGMKQDNILIDPGIGFGKSLEHNLSLLRNLEKFVASGFPVLLGASRKSFITALCEDNSTAQNRIGGSLSALLRGYDAGASIFRVHDVQETAQALKTWQALKAIHKN